MDNIKSQNQEANDALEEMIKSIIFLVQDNLKQNTTKIYSGIILSNNNDGRWNIQYNGETHPVKPYNVSNPTVGSMVKVIIPQGNQAISFFI